MVLRIGRIVISPFNTQRRGAERQRIFTENIIAPDIGYAESAGRILPVTQARIFFTNQWTDQ